MYKIILNKNKRESELNDDSHYMLNRYDIVSSFGVSLSSTYLEFSPDISEVRRSDNLGSYPSAFAFTSTLLSSITLELKSAGMKDNYLSFGILIYDKITSANLSSCIGKIEFSWGLVDQRNNVQPSEIWEQGMLVRKNRSLVQGDILSLYLDLRHQEDEDDGNNGYCHLLLNENIIHTICNLDVSQSYVFACTICPDYVVKIIPKDLRNLVNESEDVVQFIPPTVIPRTRSQEEDFLRIESLLRNADAYNNSDYDSVPRSIVHQNSVDRLLNQHIAGTLIDNPYEDVITSSNVNGSVRIPVPDTFPRQMGLLERPSIPFGRMSPNSSSSTRTASNNNSNTSNNKKKDTSNDDDIDVEKDVDTMSKSENNLCCICLENAKCVVFIPW